MTLSEFSEARPPLSDEALLQDLEEGPLTLTVLEGIPKEAERLAKLVKSIQRSKDLIRGRLEGLGMLKRVGRVPRAPPYLALDTGFTSPPLELIGGKLLIVIRSHVLHGAPSSVVEPVASVGIVKLVEEESVGKPFSKVVERRFIRDVLKLKREGKLNIKLIIVDGELFPRVPPGLKRRHGIASKLYGKVLELTNEVLELAEETETALVGVVKRSYGRDIPVVINYPEIPVNDKALATYTLNPGEWVDLETYSDLVYYLRKFIEEHGAELPPRTVRGLENRLAWIIAVMRESNYLTSSIRVAVYKAKLPTYFMAATKIEAWPSNELSMDDIVAFLSSITGVNGVPHPIDLVDSMCRVRKELLHLTQQRLQSELLKLLNDPALAMSLAGLTNPEKMHKVGFK